jgi:hypothetical protein
VNWVYVRRAGETRRLKWCLFYGFGCAVIGVTANAPWLFGRGVTVTVWSLTAIMFVVVGFRPGYRRRRTLVMLLSLAAAIRAFGSLYPEVSFSNFLLRGFVYLMLAVALTRELSGFPIREDPFARDIERRR